MIDNPAYGNWQDGWEDYDGGVARPRLTHRVAPGGYPMLGFRMNASSSPYDYLPGEECDE